MLDDNRHMYEECAKVYLPDWKNMNKNDLVRAICTIEDNNLKSAYFSAIMLKYWNKISKFYAKAKLVVSPEDVHSWLVNAIMYAIDHHPWDNETSSIYNDPNGPDKVVNRVMESRRITFYQQLNRNNRKINSDILSLDSMLEDFKDTFSPIYFDDYSFELNDIVTKLFNRLDYISAFIVDAVVFDGIKNETSSKKFMSHIAKIDGEFCIDFSKRYNLKLEDVIKGKEYCNSLTSDELRRKVLYKLIKLKEIVRE